MKILLYGVNYAPELTGIGKYSGKMTKWLVEQGHEVRVVTAPPYYPEWKIDDAYANAYRKEELKGVAIYRCPLYVPKQPSGLKRIIHLASFAVSSFPVMLRQVFWKPDVVMVIEPPLFCAPTAWMMARLSGAKCWLHIQDFEVDAAFELGIIPYAWMRKFISSMESWLMKRFDRVSTISTFMLQRLHDGGVKEPIFFPNWADLSHMKYDEAGRKSFRDKLSIPADESLCLYSGNIAIKQGLEVLLEVAQALPTYHFVICGDGASKKFLQAKATQQSLENMIFLPLQPLEELAGMLSAADIHLVVQKKGAADLVMPSKLTNILAVGGLALVTAELESELGQLSQGDAACVYRCEPENAQSLIESMMLLHKDKSLSQGIKEHAKVYAKNNIDKVRVLKHLEKALEEVTR